MATGQDEKPEQPVKDQAGQQPPETLVGGTLREALNALLIRAGDREFDVQVKITHKSQADNVKPKDQV